MLFLDPFSDAGDEMVQLDVRVFKGQIEILNDSIESEQKTLSKRKIESSFTPKEKDKYSQRHSFTLDLESLSSNDTLCI